MRQAITPLTLNKIFDLIPEEWLEEESAISTPDTMSSADTPSITPAERREAYRTFLTRRLAESHIFTREAIRQRSLLK